MKKYYLKDISNFNISLLRTLIFDDKLNDDLLDEFKKIDGPLGIENHIDLLENKTKLGFTPSEKYIIDNELNDINIFLHKIINNPLPNIKYKNEYENYINIIENLLNN